MAKKFVEPKYDVYKVDEVNLVLERDFYIVGSPKITSSEAAVNIFRQFWKENLINIQEQMSVMLLNQANKVIGMYQHSSGTINSTVMDNELIAAVAVKSLAKGVIVAHNHPSGNLMPSDADIKASKALKAALELFNIKLIDSLIIVQDSERYTSLVDEGQMEFGGIMASGGVASTLEYDYYNPYDEYYYPYGETYNEGNPEWVITNKGKTPEEDVGYWENYKNASESDLAPTTGRYAGHYWILLGDEENPIGYWHKLESGGYMAKGGEVAVYEYEMRDRYDKEKKEWIREPLTLKRGQLVYYEHSEGSKTEAKFLAKAGDRAKIEILHPYRPFTRRVELRGYVNSWGRTEPDYYLKEVPRGTIKTVSVEKIEPDIEFYYKGMVRPISKLLKSVEFKEAFSYLDNVKADGGYMAKGGITSKEKNKVPDYIVTSVSSSEIPSQNLPKADVGLGLKMGSELGRGIPLTKEDYSLSYSNGKVVLELTPKGKIAVRVKSEKVPNYLDTIKNISNEYLSNYAKKIKKNYAMGGATFKEKVAAITKKNLERKKVPKAVQKDYGKTFSKKEAEESAKRIAGAMAAKERFKAKMAKKKK